MSVDYKVIADSDPGGALDDAFYSLKAETVSSTPEVMVTYRRISAAVSLAASAALEGVIKFMESEGSMPSWVNTSLSTDGVDVNNPQVAGLLADIIPDYSDAILAMGIKTEPKYPNLKKGHLVDARRLREEGLI